MSNLIDRLNMAEGEVSVSGAMIFNKKGHDLSMIADIMEEFLSDNEIYNDDDNVCRETALALADVVMDFGSENAKFSGEMTIWLEA